MYVSNRLELVEYVVSSTHVYLRANCAASMKNETRYPGVAIKIESGQVDFARCTCQAYADQRCAHVACLLYLAEDLSLGQDPRIAKPCTSQLQYWGKGSKKELDPGVVTEKNYSKKREQNRYVNFDPRPENAQPPNDEEFLRDLQSLARPYEPGKGCMWEKLLRYNYQDQVTSGDDTFTLDKMITRY